MAKSSSSDGQTTEPDDGLQRLAASAVFLIVLIFGGGLAWGSLTEISGAVIGTGQIVTETNTKSVQHPDGGLVAEVLVEDKVQVEKGQILLRLDATLLQTQMDIVEKNLDAQEARLARLIAERDEQQGGLVLPERLARRQGITEARLAVEREADYMVGRKASRAAKKDQIVQRIAQAENEIKGFEEQRRARATELRINKIELADLEKLLAKGYVPTARVYPLQKEVARLEGAIGELDSSLARTADRISELKIQLIQIEDDFRTQVLDDMRLTSTRTAELYEKRIAAEERLRRIEIRSPDAGTVQELTVFAGGAVIKAGDAIMKVVPKEDRLTIETRIQNIHIDQVAIGQNAFLRFTSLNRRLTPELRGEVTRISGDVSQDPVTKQYFYATRIDITPDELRKLGEVRLSAGMPVEAFVETDRRPPLSYLVKPLADQLARALRER